MKKYVVFFIFVFHVLSVHGKPLLRRNMVSAASVLEQSFPPPPPINNYQSP